MRPAEPQSISCALAVRRDGQRPNNEIRPVQNSWFSCCEGFEKAVYNVTVPVFDPPLASRIGPANSAGQTVLRLHAGHHSNHPRGPHQQLWDHQTARAARCLHTPATRRTLQLRGVLVQLRRRRPAPLALPPQHLQGPRQPVSHRPVQWGSVPHGFPAQLGAGGAQHGGERVQVRVWGAVTNV